MNVELIPSARRLIRSLRDIGYEFVDAVADIIDNSIEAGATVVSVSLKFDGENSYLTISDNGIGMASKEIQEALRFGSSRSYDEENDLGRFGLGLKTASLSQCERLTVSARRGEERARINSYCWDLDHIEKTNRWEVLKVDVEQVKDEVRDHLRQTTGTVVTWERLGRLLGYKYPSGEYARKASEQMIAGLMMHLGLVFHRFLAGEVSGKRISIYLNDVKVMAWDPYSRAEVHTLKLDPILIPLDFRNSRYNIRILPYILPPQSLYSSIKAHLSASGPGKWNKQQGLYIYRANRVIQAGGWSGLRTSDEHTKLVRLAMFIPSQMDDLFQVNVAKKYANLPRELRPLLLEAIQPIISMAQEIYREKGLSSVSSVTGNPAEAIRDSEINAALVDFRKSAKVRDQGTGESGQKRVVGPDLEFLMGHVLKKVKAANDPEKLIGVFRDIYAFGDEVEQNIFEKLLRRYVSS